MVLLAGGERCGPVPDEVLQLLAGSGRLQESDLVWSEGEPDWKPALQIPILSKVLEGRERAIRSEGVIRLAEKDAAREEMGAISERTRQAVMVGDPIRLLALLLQTRP
jgi:hypothetical protein